MTMEKIGDEEDKEKEEKEMHKDAIDMKGVGKDEGEDKDGREEKEEENGGKKRGRG